MFFSRFFADYRARDRLENFLFEYFIAFPTINLIQMTRGPYGRYKKVKNI